MLEICGRDMVTRVVGFANKERRRDRRREIVIESTLDGAPIDILDISLSGFGAAGAKEVSKGVTWPTAGQRAELKFTDYKGREVLVLVKITNITVEDGRFGGTYFELPGEAFDVIQDLVMHKDLRAAAE